MINDIEFIYKILENPNIKKYYIDYKNYLIKNKKEKESKVIEHIINKKFIKKNVMSDTDNNQK